MSEHKTKEKIPSFRERLLMAQMEIGTIKKTSSNPFFKSKYFDINAILAEVKPVLNKHGLIILQPLVTRDGRNSVETCIMDSYSDQTFASVVYLPNLEDPQKMGSAITYFRRYGLQSVLALEAEDDDGNVASAKTTEKKYAPVLKKPVEVDEPPFSDNILP